jgi:hypothetical protein
MPHVRSKKIIGLARSASPTLRGLLERISSGVGQARGYSIRIRGKRADVWSPHTVLGRGVPCRGIVASSHGLGCEYGCRDQRSRHDHFGHLSLHMVAEAKEALSSCCEERPALGDISSRAFNEARAAVIIGSLETTLTLK